MMTVIHQRFIQNAVTFSKLTLPWMSAPPEIYGIELPWKGNQHELSCIPAGIYTCQPFFSPKRQEKCWQLLNVRDRQNIEIHVGNFASSGMLNGKPFTTNTDGCLMYGFGIEESVPMITKSIEATGYLRTQIGLDRSFLMDVRDCI